MQLAEAMKRYSPRVRRIARPSASITVLSRSNMGDEVLDARQQRALAIVRSDKAKRIKHMSGARWLVPSQADGGGYLVDVDAQTCSCPDHGERGVRCKHLWAIIYLR